MKKVIHVNRHHIAKNKKGFNIPVISIKGLTKNITYTNSVKILGPSEIIYSEKPLSCGANLWIETDSELEILDPKSYKEVKDEIDKSKKRQLSG